MENQVNPLSGNSESNFITYQWNSILENPTGPQQVVIQTAGKKIYSQAFNMSKRTGKSICELLTPVLPDPNNKEMQQAVEIALYQWLLTNPLQDTAIADPIPFITSMQFNEEYSLHEMSKKEMQVNRKQDNGIELNIPSLNPVNDIAAPLRTESLKFKIMAISCNMTDGSKSGGYITEIDIPYNDEQLLPQNILLPITAKQGHLVIVALTVEYTVFKEAALQAIHNQRWMPAGILWAGYN